MAHQQPSPVLGTRGDLLLWCAAVWLLIGARVAAGADDEGGPALLHLWLPEFLRVALWWVPASLAVYAALTHRAEWLAVGALILAPIVRAVSYAWAGVTYYVPVGEPGLHDGLVVSLIYLLMVGLVWIIVRVKEPIREAP